MRYCDTCADLRLWPHSFTQIVGECELCFTVKPCNDVPKSGLPLPDSPPAYPFVPPESEAHS